MKAMIFAAGLGTRLRPLTDDRPKALVEIGGFSLLQLSLLRLEKAGVKEVVVNVHHFADKVISHIKEFQTTSTLNIIISDERDELLETGGGLKKAGSFLRGRDPIFVCNVDILTTLDPLRLLEAHQAANPSTHTQQITDPKNQVQALATLAVRNRNTSRNFLFDSSLRLRGWRNNQTGDLKMCFEGQKLESELSKDQILIPLAFSGLQIIDPALLDKIPQSGKFSIVETYLSLGGDHRIKGFLHDDTEWLDVGKPESLPLAHKLLEKYGPGNV